METVISVDLIKKLKKENGFVYLVEVYDEDVEIAEVAEEKKSGRIPTIDEPTLDPKAHYAILRKPTKREIGVAMTMKDPVQLGEFLLKNLSLFTDPQLTENEDLAVSAALEAAGTISLKKASLKKF